MKHLPLFAFFVFIMLVGCKKDEYLYYSIPPQAAIVNKTHRVKEAQSASKVDIVWVIDNSGSMGDHQDNLRTNSDIFIQNFSQSAGISWTISLLSTSLSEDPYLGFGGPDLNWMTPDPVAVFQRVIRRLGVSGDGRERSFDPVMRQIKDSPTYLRKDAILALIFLTDAKDQSDVETSEFLSFLAQTKGSLKKVVSYGILGPQDWGCNVTDSEWNYAGSTFEEVITATNGKTFKLCSPDFGTALAKLSKDLVQLVANPRFYLEHRPKASTIRVLFGQTVLPNGPPEKGGLWTYDFELNAVVFNDLSFAPGDDDKVQIEYEIDDGF